MNNLLIDRQVIRNNLQELRKDIEGSVCADLSGDAYGMGAVETARLLREDGVRTFAVSDYKDASRLRKNGFTQERIIMLRSILDKNELEKLMDLNVVFCVASSEAGVVLNGIADARGTVVEVQLRIDTGAGRGFHISEIDKLFSLYRYMPNLAIVGVATDFGEQAIGKKTIKEKFTAFELVLEKMAQVGIDQGETMLIDTFGRAAGKLETPDTFIVGAALAGYGGYENAGSIMAAIEEISWVTKGSRVGGKVLSKPAKVAILSVGSRHGFNPSEKGLGMIKKVLGLTSSTVRINGSKARIIGKPSLFSTAVDVTDVVCGVGDQVRIDVDTMTARGLDRSYR